MESKLEALKDIDDEIFQVFEKASEHIPNLLKGKYPNLTEVCFMYISSSNFLKNSVFDSADTDNYYSANVLFRSLIEHYLRFNYFWFINGKDFDDQYALKFKTVIDFIEQIEIKKSTNAILQINNIETKTSNQIWNELIEAKPDFKNFSKEEIRDFAQNLSIKNIIRYIERNIKKGDIESNPFLQDMILKYQNMSSFVHGGIYAHMKMLSFDDPKKREDELIALSGLALQVATSVKLFSYLTFFQFMPEFGNPYNDTLKLMKKIINTK